MYDEIFSNSFNFNYFNFDKYKYTDNRKGLDTHYFAYMVSGHCKIQTENELVNVREGDVFYIPNGCKYQSFWYGEPEVKFISLGFVFMPNFEKKEYPPQVIKTDNEAVKLFYRLVEKVMPDSSDVGVFYTLVGMLIPKMRDISRSRTEEIVERTKNYLNINPFSSVAELAKNCSISESALYSAFQKSSDETINELRNRIKAEKARVLLVTTNMSVEEISGNLLFSSCSYFRKVLRKYLNATPSEIRKTHKI